MLALAVLVGRGALLGKATARQKLLAGIFAGVILVGLIASLRILPIWITVPLFIFSGLLAALVIRASPPGKISMNQIFLAAVIFGSVAFIGMTVFLRILPLWVSIPVFIFGWLLISEGLAIGGIEIAVDAFRRGDLTNPKTPVGGALESARNWLKGFWQRLEKVFSFQTAGIGILKLLVGLILLVALSEVPRQGKAARAFQRGAGAGHGAGGDEPGTGQPDAATNKCNWTCSGGDFPTNRSAEQITPVEAGDFPHAV
jgi:hypothetical protein